MNWNIVGKNGNLCNRLGVRTYGTCFRELRYFIFRRGSGGISVLILFYFRLAALGALADVPGPQVPVPDLREAWRPGHHQQKPQPSPVQVSGDRANIRSSTARLFQVHYAIFGQCQIHNTGRCYVTSTFCDISGYRMWWFTYFDVSR